MQALPSTPHMAYLQILYWAVLSIKKLRNLAKAEKAQIGPPKGEEEKMTKKPWYLQTPTIIAALVLFAPVGIPLMWWGTEWSKKTKQVLAVLSGIFFLVVVGRGLFGGKDDRTKPRPTKVSAEPKTQQKIPVESPSLSEGVIIEFKLEGIAEKRPIVIGETNLPTGTNLMVEIVSLATNKTYQSESRVEEGQFKAGPFAPSEGLPTGSYRASVTMPVPEVQPQNVKDVIGPQGEKLAGALVKRGEMGLTVETEQLFTIGEPNEAAATDQASLELAKKEAPAILAELAELEKQGRDMEPMRTSRDLAQKAQCGELMREKQKKAEDLLMRSEKLPAPLNSYLRSASISLKMCVSCSASVALQSCDNVKASSKEGSRALKEKGW